MKYSNTVRAKFIQRLNRFVAEVELDGKKETVHVKNTGRCRELLLPKAEVILADGMNTDRKTKYDLITVWKENLGWVNIDSQVPNTLVKEWLEREGGRQRSNDLSGKPTELRNLKRIRPEYTYGSSRVDFYLESEDKKILMEVKGCTLEIGGIGYFPDAPTERGIKHLKELSSAVKDGYSCYLAFVIAMPGIKEVRPNMQTHPAFGEALSEAEKSGVKVLFLCCEVREDEISISECHVKRLDHE